MNRFSRYARRLSSATNVGKVIGLVVVLLTVALAVVGTSPAQGEDGIKLSASLQCNILAGQEGRAFLQWTRNGNPLSGDPKTSDSWTCKGNNKDAHNTWQPLEANDWHVNLEIWEQGGLQKIKCPFDGEFTEGEAKTISEVCSTGGDNIKVNIGPGGTPTATPTATATPTSNGPPDTPTPTPTEPPPVGGVIEPLDVAGAPLATGESSGLSAGVLAGIAAGAAAGAFGLGGAAWYVRRRLG